jgi:hypothetical protein
LLTTLKLWPGIGLRSLLPWRRRSQSLQGAGKSLLADPVIDALRKRQLLRRHVTMDNIRAIQSMYRFRWVLLWCTLFSSHAPTEAKGVANCAATIHDMDLGSRIGGIRTPTLVFTGTRDNTPLLEGHGGHLFACILGDRAYCSGSRTSCPA